MLPTLEVHTLLDGTSLLAGVARFSLRHGQISTTFTYDDDYMALPGAYVIDPKMPFVPKVHHRESLPGSFRDSSPDRWGRNLVAGGWLRLTWRRSSKSSDIRREIQCRAFGI